MKFKMLELEEKIWTNAGKIHCSPANLTVRKIRDEVNSPPSVQAPVDADRYQGVVTQWYSPLSLDEYTQIVWIDDWALLCHFSLYLIVIIAPNTYLSWVPCIFNKYVFVSLRSIETSLDELRASFHTTPKRSMLATWMVVSPPRSRVKNQRTS